MGLSAGCDFFGCGGTDWGYVSQADPGVIDLSGVIFRVISWGWPIIEDAGIGGAAGAVGAVGCAVAEPCGISVGTAIGLGAALGLALGQRSDSRGLMTVSCSCHIEVNGASVGMAQGVGTGPTFQSARAAAYADALRDARMKLGRPTGFYLRHCNYFSE